MYRRLYSADTAEAPVLQRCVERGISYKVPVGRGATGIQPARRDGDMEGFDGKERSGIASGAASEGRTRSKWSTPRVIVSAMAKAGAAATTYHDVDQHSGSVHGGPIS
jgi:hypothetical protein